MSNKFEIIDEKWFEKNGLFQIGKNESYTCCVCGGIGKGNRLIILQCRHVYHKKCLNRYMMEGVGKYVDCIKADKSKFLKTKENISDDSKSLMKMHILDEPTDMTFKCAHKSHQEDVLYSVASYISRSRGIPKMVFAVCVFFEQNDRLYYHLCSRGDMIHFTDKNEQIELFNKFNIDNEYDIDISIEEELSNQPTNEYHCLIKNKDDLDVFKLASKERCKACKNEKGYKHASIRDYSRIIYGII